MFNNILKKALILVLGFLFIDINGQTPPDSLKTEEEDYSMYENVEDLGEIKVWCSPKIFDLSPNRFVSLGYDYTANAPLSTSPLGAYKEGQDTIQRTTNLASHGIRLNANIPVISKSNFIWQFGGGFNQARYNYTLSNLSVMDDHARFLNQLNRPLTTVNLNTTIFKPLSEFSFVIAQLQAEQSGNYNFAENKNEPNLANTRTSMSVIYGKRPHDRKQWGVGLSRTYRAGELNYIPIVMFNYTAENRKWGTEILFPARAAYRRKFSPRNILLIGYELEGSSYRLYNHNFGTQNLELRRSEIRFRFDYQRQIKGFVWLGLQAGLRYNYTFHVDDLGPSNKDFFRGFFGNQTYAMLNTLGHAPYVNLSFNFVSP